MKIVINLAPSDLKKRGSHFDLGMAVGILLQNKQINFDGPTTFGFIGELSLNGDLRPCSGILPMAIEAKNRGIKNLIVPKDNLNEASLVSDINIFGFDNLKEVINFLEGVENYTQLELKSDNIICRNSILDFEDVQGQDSAIEFIIAAAEAGHNIILSGSPGYGKSMIAKRLPTILLSMTKDEALMEFYF